MATTAVVRSGLVAAAAVPLDAYRVACDFHALATALMPSLRPTLRDQLERASASAALNVAEGFGRRSPRQQAYHYGVARGSAVECGRGARPRVAVGNGETGRERRAAGISRRSPSSLRYAGWGS